MDGTGSVAAEHATEAMSGLAGMLTPERLKEVLEYNPDSGCFTWKQRTRKGRGGSCRIAGENAGCRCYREGKPHHVSLKIDGNLYAAHRVAWMYCYGEWPPRLIDHINHDPFDNRISNLRLATTAENVRNRRGADKRNKSGMRGVCSFRGKWRAAIGVDNRIIWLGDFDDKRDAKLAYDTAAKKFFGEFAGAG